MASVFTQIIQGKLPAYRIFEDDLTLSFLSHAPINPGHTLVITKQEIDYFLDVPSKLYQAVMQHCQTIGPAIQKASGKKRVCMAIQGFEVPHFHVHLIACDGPREFDFSQARTSSPEEMGAMADKITTFLPT